MKSCTGGKGGFKIIDLLLDVRKDLCSANVGYKNGKGSTGIFCEGEKQF